MFRESLNHLSLTFRLIPKGPVLIKSGREAGADPTLVDMNFVRTHRYGFDAPTVFIPGSSLKGVLRSYAERVLRTTLGEGTGPKHCCNPFDERSFCGKRLEKEEDTAARYRESCPACRIFGNTVVGGRLSAADAYPPAEVIGTTNATEQRDGVAIDRIKGGALDGGLFTLEVVTRGAFESTLQLENFELWQVGLLAIALRDLGTGVCPIGFGKTRGLGQMEVTLETLDVRYPCRFEVRENGRDYGKYLYPVSVFHPEWCENAAYGLSQEAGISLEACEPKLLDQGTLGQVAFRISGDPHIRSAFGKAAEAWKGFALAQKEGTAS